MTNFKIMYINYVILINYPLSLQYTHLCEVLQLLINKIVSSYYTLYVVNVRSRGLQTLLLTILYSLFEISIENVATIFKLYNHFSVNFRVISKINSSVNFRVPVF